MKSRILVLWLVILCGFISCTKHDDSDQKKYEIRLEYKSFHPFQMTVPVGTTVIFNNTGGGTHNVTGNLFSSGNIKVDDSYSYTFNAVGSYSFNCFVHSNSQEQTSIRVE